jgi:perosamine synthetase
MFYFGLSWSYFYKKFKANGGDGFYAAWMLPFNEPFIKNSKKIIVNKKDCFNAVELQKKLILLKTNYRNLRDARKQAKILKNTINQINANFS